MGKYKIEQIKVWVQGKYGKLNFSEAKKEIVNNSIQGKIGEKFSC